MSVRLWPVLPKDYAENGLGAIEKLMLDDGAAEFYVIARVCRRRYGFDDHTKEMTPQAEVLHVEALLGDFAPQGEQLLKDAYSARTERGALLDPAMGNGDDTDGE